MPARIIPLQIYQNTMSKALERMTKSNDIREVFNDVLKEILDYYNAGRVVVMTTIPDMPDFQTSLFEVDAPGVKTVMECMGGVFPKSKWRYSQVQAGKTVIVDDILKMKECKHLATGMDSLKPVFEKLDVKSHIAVPIVDFHSRPSFLCVDIVNRAYHWTKQDERLIKDVANIVMMWGKLQASNRKVNDEKDFLRAVLGKIPVGIAMFDVDGNITYANRKLLHVFGVGTLDNIKNFNLFNSHILSEYELQSIRERESFESVFDYGYGNKPTVKNKLQDDSMHIMAKYCKLRDNMGNLKSYIATYVDRTRETSASEKVKELDGYMSVCAEFAKIGFARVNVMTGEGYGTKQWFLNFGIDNENNSHQYSETLERLHQDEKRSIRQFRSVVMIDPAVTFKRRVRVMKNDGSGEYDYLQMYSVVTRYEPQKGVVETSTISLNVNHNVDMEVMLRTARDQAEKADRLKSAFLANMSHEIRTPLNAIVGFSQLLCDDMVEPEERGEVVSIIENNNTLLLQLISDILDLAKLEAGTLEFRYSDTEMNSLCKAVASSVKMRVKPGVELIVDIPDKKFNMYTDPNRVKQVLINFATNAAKFTDSGHIRLGYIPVGSHNVRIFVEDTGIGISKDKISKVFERFVKLNQFEQGNGLGLQISREIVTKLGGKIGVDSELGKGSTFWCIIPVNKK